MALIFIMQPSTTGAFDCDLPSVSSTLPAHQKKLHPYLNFSHSDSRMLHKYHYGPHAKVEQKRFLDCKHSYGRLTPGSDDLISFSKLIIFLCYFMGRDIVANVVRFREQK
jgi:hypothetical protein